MTGGEIAGHVASDVRWPGWGIWSPHNLCACPASNPGVRQSTGHALYRMARHGIVARSCLGVYASRGIGSLQDRVC